MGKFKELFIGYFKTIIKHPRLRNIWIFGIILMFFCIFVNFKLLLVLFLIIIVWTAATLKVLNEEDSATAIDLEQRRIELEEYLVVTREHIATGNATLEEKLEAKEMEEELNEINEYLYGEKK